MTARKERAAQEAVIQNLRAEGQALQKRLATVVSEYGVYLKKSNGVSELVRSEVMNSQNTTTVTVPKTASKDAMIIPTNNAMDAVILVLIDGMSHMVHDELYSNNGGAKTAMRLRAVVREKLAAVLPAIARSGQYQIVIKIFACLKRLRERFIARKLPIPGLRSLTFHFTEFTKVSPFYDFVNTGDENQVSVRISENLKLHMANGQCKHIFFCAAGSPRYHDTLNRHLAQKEKVTIVTGSVVDENIRRLGLRTISFANVFKASRLNYGLIDTTTKPTSIKAPAELITPKLSSTSVTAVPTKGLTSVSLVAKEVDAPPLPSPLPTQARYGLVPINLARQRLDFRMQIPTPAELQAYKERSKVLELCIDFHLHGNCIASDCMLSHGSPLSPEVYNVLEYKALGTPCSKGSECRSLDCINAHVCQKEECARAGGRAALCGLTDAMHHVDPHVAEWVVGYDDAVQSDSPAQGDVISIAGPRVDGGGSAASWTTRLDELLS